MSEPKKSLGQHWLHDETALEAMVLAADVQAGDIVLEIGPGLGTLTEKLLAAGARVHAVEFDEELIPGLHAKFAKQSQFTLEQTDILKFDFGSLPSGHKVVANIPYYLTSHLFRILADPATNQPAAGAFLVQKEVAERVAAQPGEMSILSVAVQLSFDTGLGRVVPAELFTPPPKVDSQILIFKKPTAVRFLNMDYEGLMRLVRAGFSERRKKLRSSLSGGLGISKPEAEQLLARAGIDPNLRAQALSLDDWYRLYQNCG